MSPRQRQNVTQPGAFLGEAGAYPDGSMPQSVRTFPERHTAGAGGWAAGHARNGRRTGRKMQEQFVERLDRQGV